jgi:hypothetical protein
MLNANVSSNLLLVTMLISGCDAPVEPASSAPAVAKPNSRPALAVNSWVTSNDGKLELRFSVISPRVKANESIQAVAEIRNASQQRITVLRPFGDWYSAEALGMKIWDGERQITYSGPTPGYVIGSDAFAVIGPGEIAKDRLELTTDNFAGTGPPGQYSLRYDYSYDGQWDDTAASGNSGISDAWRGTISSREIQVFRE